MNHYPPIDWTAQWEAHGYNFQDGFVVIDLLDFNCESPNPNPVKLKPGPGFGDLSHPTTKLILKMISNHVKDEYVLDIGCGSGVLSIASIAMGAKFAYGIDIDLEAINHSQENAQVNEMTTKTQFSLAKAYHPPKPETTIVVLMNMIQSEQKVAWESVSIMHSFSGMALVSGILAKDKQLYLSQTEKWGWQLLSEIQMEDWVGLSFLRK